MNAITIHRKAGGSELEIERTVCAACNTYECVRACITGALSLCGISFTPDKLFRRISRDRQYWGARGGITLTGGEPFAQPDFTSSFLNLCWDAYIHTAVETCGNVPWSAIEGSLPFIDWIFYDLKTMRPGISFNNRNEQETGKESMVGRILENGKKLAAGFSGRLIYRLPVIPGYNDDTENLELTATYIVSTGRKEINILPLHHFGREKYRLSGRNYTMTDVHTPEKTELHRIADIFTSQGIRCYIGSETPF